MANEERKLTRPEILEILPHGDRFMFLSEATIVEPGKKAIGKLVDREDFDFLDDHFSGFNVLPGGLALEALAELLSLAVISGGEINPNKIGVLAGDNMRYKDFIRPDEDVSLEAEVANFRKNFGIGRGNVKMSVNGIVRAQGEITFAIVDKPPEMRST